MMMIIQLPISLHRGSRPTHSQHHLEALDWIELINFNKLYYNNVVENK